MAQVTEISALLETRIRRGDFGARGFPTERELARETGAARMTVSKAVDHLVAHRILIRQPNGRLAVRRKRDGKAAVMRVGFLAPSFFSPDNEAWYVAIDQAAAKLGATVCPVFYRDWESSALREALTGYDGVFLLSHPDPMPDKILRLLRDPAHPVVSLDRDLTEWCLPTVDAFPRQVVRRLLDHLRGLGHRHIDCLNIEHVCPIIAGRITEWRKWCATNQVTGRLIDDSLGPYPQFGYQALHQELIAQRFQATALLATTMPAAVRAARAFHDAGWQVGRDVSLAVINDENTGQFQVPSLTCLRRPNTAPLLETCLEWMARGGQRWMGPHLLQAREVPLVSGESTGPAPTTPRNL